MDKLLEKIEQKVFLPSGLVCVFIMTLLTTCDTVGRYILRMPISGSYDIIENYLMIAIFYFIISYAYREGANIRITLFVEKLPRHMRLFFNYVVQVVAILYCLFLFVTSLLCNLPRLNEMLVLTKYNLPLMPVFLLIPIGLMLLTLRMIVDLWHIKDGKSGLFKEEAAEESIVA